MKIQAIKVKCSWPVYKATDDDGRDYFVKISSPELIKEARELLAEAGESEFLPKIVDLEIPEFAGKNYICLEWVDAKHIEPEDMTDSEADSLVDGYLRFSKTLAKITRITEREAAEKTDYFYERVADYAKSHPVVSRVMKDLVEIPESERSYSNHTEVHIHGDFHSLNYGFRDGRLAAIFDPDKMTKGLRCEDVAYAFSERCRRSSLAPAKRKRLESLLMRCISRSPWPKEEWIIAMNRFRLRIAAHRIAKHPDSPFTAFDIARRDKNLRKLSAMISGGRVR